MNVNQIHEEVKKRIHAFRQKQKRLAILISVCNGFILFLLTVLLFSVLETLYWFSPDAKIFIWHIIFIVLTLFFIVFVFFKIFNYLFKKKHPDTISLALKIGLHIPAVKDELADALQVYWARNQKQRPAASPFLAESALRQAYEKLKTYQFTEFVDNAKLFIKVKFSTAIVLLVFLLYLLFPNLKAGFNRLLHAETCYDKPKAVIIKVLPGDVTLIENDTLQIEIDLIKGSVNTLQLIMKFEDEAEKSVLLQNPYRYTISDIQKSGQYYIKTNDYQSSRFQIKLLKRPFVHAFQWQIQPPVYTKLQPQTLQKNEGNLSILKGSVLFLSLKATKPLDKAAIIWNQATIPLKTKENQASGRFRFSESGLYHFEIQDTSGIINSQPITYHVSVQPDQYPLASIRSPEKQVDLTEQLLLPLSLEAEDDFGILKMKLAYWIHNLQGTGPDQDTSVIDIPLAASDKKFLQQSYTWDLKNLNLFPEDVVYYVLKVADNDHVSGPKWGFSEIHIARFPSIYEIFEEVRQEQARQIDSFEEQYEKSKTLLDILEKVEKEIRTGQEVTWEEKHELEKAVKKQQQIQKEVASLKQDLQAMVEKMDENELLNETLFEKYQELQELYEDIATPELLDAMQKFQDLLQNMKTPELQQAVEQMQIDQKQMMQSLERTIELLKRIQTEQKMDELIQKVENIKERQSSINEGLHEKDHIDSTLMHQQEGIQKDFNHFLNELADLKEMMKEFKQMPNYEMAEFLDSLQQSNADQMFSEMQTHMTDKNSQVSREKGEQIEQSLDTIKQQLIQMQEAMSQKSQQAVAKAFQRISYKLMQASQAQEQLGHNQIPSSGDQNKKAKTQQSLQRFTQSIGDSLQSLSQETMGVTPDMFQSLSEALQKMNQATQSLSNRQTAQASIQQNQAMGALNRALLAIQNTMNQMQGQSGSGMEQFMNQMNQMTRQQMALNQQLMQMLQQGQLSLAQQAALKRLAAEQQAIQKSLREMMKQYGSQGEHMGRLDRLIEEMQASVEEMRSAQADRKTLERQERILSRMLDAQRSIREKEYSKKREGRSGKDKYRPTPEEMDLSKTELRKQIEKNLLHLTEEGYSENDQELIRDYFQILLKETIE